MKKAWVGSGVVFASVLGLALGASQSKTAAVTAHDPETRAAMAKVYDPIAKLLPYSIDEAKFSDPRNKQAILTELKQLAVSANKLAQHGRSRNQNFAFLSQSLERNAKDTLFSFEKGKPEMARFALLGLTDTCIACHSRLPSQEDFAGARGLFARSDFTDMDLRDRFRWLTATRQFGDAMALYEKAFLDPKMSSLSLIGWNTVTEYLVLGIRVKGDLKRSASGLLAIRSKADFPASAAAEIDAWITALDQLAAKSAANTDLAEARAILKRGRDINEYPMDRTGLVHFVYASGLLLRYIEGKSHQGGDLAEAYYLLGLSDSIISRTIWVPQTDFFFETAVRLAPTTEIGGKALAALEDNLAFEYGGSGGVHLPPEAQGLLRELKQLVGDKTKKKI